MVFLPFESPSPESRRFSPPLSSSPMQNNRCQRGQLPLPNGICNLGNTCYLASVIQVLAHCRAFVRAVVFLDTADRGQLVDAIRDVVRAVWSGDDGDATGATGGEETNMKTGRSVSPYRIARCVARPYFDPFVQNDAHELYCLMADVLIEDRDRTFADMLQGEKKSAIRCGNCHHVSETAEKFVDLQVDLVVADDSQIRPQPANTPALVDDLITASFGAEWLSERKCDRCRSKGGMRVVSVTRWPTVLVVLAKRFGHGNNVCRRPVVVRERLSRKKLQSVCYTDAARQLAYDRYVLVGAVCHVGCQSFGHYTAVVRHPGTPSLGWLHADDAVVRQVPAGVPPIRGDQVYMLLYEMVPSPIKTRQGYCEGSGITSICLADHQRTLHPRQADRSS